MRLSLTPRHKVPYNMFFFGFGRSNGRDQTLHLLSSYLGLAPFPPPPQLIQLSIMGGDRGGGDRPLNDSKIAWSGIPPFIVSWLRISLLSLQVRPFSVAPP